MYGHTFKLLVIESKVETGTEGVFEKEFLAGITVVVVVLVVEKEGFCVGIMVIVAVILIDLDMDDGVAVDSGVVLVVEDVEAG